MAVLLPYQRRWFEDRSRVKICEKSRRIGITWTTAAECVTVAARRQSAGGMDCWYLCNHEGDSREFIEDVADWSRALGAHCSDVSEEMIEDESDSILAYVVRYSSGHKVHALSSRPRRLRGKQGYAIHDEAGHADDLGEFLKAAHAFVMWGGRVAIMSTHNGAESQFAQHIESVRAKQTAGVSIHRITLDDAITDGLFPRIAARTGLPDTPAACESWRADLFEIYGDNADEELLCIPSASGGVYIERGAIERCTLDQYRVIRYGPGAAFEALPVDERAKIVDAWIASTLRPELLALNRGRVHAMGQDFGRVSDLSVLVPMEIGEDLKRRVPFVVELRGVPFAQQHQIAAAMVAGIPNLRRAHFDATGNGAEMAERMADRFGRKIEQIKITAKWHAEAWPPLRAAIQDRKILIPADDRIVRDIRSIRVVDGLPRIPRASSSDRGTSRHGDAAVAIAMAYAAARGDAAGFSFSPVERDDDWAGGIL